MKIARMVAVAVMVFSASAQAQAQETNQPNKQETPQLYYHAYKPAITGKFQLQPGQGFAIVQSPPGFTRMVQVCVQAATALTAMPVPTPTLATSVRRGPLPHQGSIPVGSCALLEGEQIAIGLADGGVDGDTSADNKRRALAFMSGSYTILGYYSHTKPDYLVPKKE